MDRKSQKVCVTGASGFVGSQIVFDLLEAGYEVHGTVRDPSNLEKYGFLLQFPGAEERLTLHEGRLREAHSFEAAMEDCTSCIHTASPYALDVKNPLSDLVEPAVEGTKNVLNAAHKAGVRRVVVTSSMAAITDEPESDRVLTEEDWNEKSSVERNPYYFSKVEAEKAAWRFAESMDDVDLVTINPFLIIGPSKSPSLNTSNQILVDLLSKEYPGIISLTWGMVDVRDVSRAHLLALSSETAKGRFICVDNRISMKEVVELLAANGYGKKYSLPRLDLACSAGDVATKVFSFFQPKGTGSYLRTHLGRVPQFDSSKSKEVLGLEYRSIEESILETIRDLEQWGHLKA